MKVYGLSKKAWIENVSAFYNHEYWIEPQVFSDCKDTYWVLVQLELKSYAVSPPPNDCLNFVVAKLTDISFIFIDSIVHVFIFALSLALGQYYTIFPALRRYLELGLALWFDLIRAQRNSGERFVPSQSVRAEEGTKLPNSCDRRWWALIVWGMHWDTARPHVTASSRAWRGPSPESSVPILVHTLHKATYARGLALITVYAV